MTKFHVIPNSFGEVDYIASCVRNWRETKGNIRLPEELVRDLECGRSVTAFELLTYMEKDRSPRETYRKLQAALDVATPAIAVFLHRFRRMPALPLIDVFVTRYGPGGTYHPYGQSLYHSPHHRHQFASITVMDPRTAAKGDRARNGFVARVFHETLHLMIEESVVRRFDLTHEQKEAVVDRICQADDLRQVLGGPYEGQGFDKHLPEDWLDMVPWRDGGIPTWSDQD